MIETSLVHRFFSLVLNLNYIYTFSLRMQIVHCRKKQVPFIMAIENVELMQRVF